MEYKLAKFLKDSGFPQVFKEGDWFYTACSSLSYAYGGMKAVNKSLFLEREKPIELPESSGDLKPQLLTKNGVDSGYYGWGLAESFPEEEELQKRYFIKIPSLSELVNMVMVIETPKTGTGQTPEEVVAFLWLSKKNQRPTMTIDALLG